jgi:hypothetical protein
LILEKWSFCQDRLRTNIGKPWKKRVFSRRATAPTTTTKKRRRRRRRRDCWV